MVLECLSLFQSDNLNEFAKQFENNSDKRIKHYPRKTELFGGTTKYTRLDPMKVEGSQRKVPSQKSNFVLIT